MRNVLLAVILVCVCTTTQAQGATELAPNRWTLYEENDIHLFSRVSGRDRHYTQGLKFQRLYPEGDVAGLIDRATRRLQHHWGGCGVFQGQAHCSSGWSLGQNIYTPQNIADPMLQPDERPYAAWLYGGAVFEMRTPRREGTNDVSMDRVVELDVGMMGGPLALGRFIQTNWHNLLGIDPPKGWINQVHNEPGVELNYSRTAIRQLGSRYHGWSVDFVDRRGAALGNIFTNVNVTPTLRFGYNMSENFSNPIPQPAPAPPPMASSAWPPSQSPTPVEFYFFGGGGGSLIAWNELVEGNCCAHPASHGKPLRHAVATLDWGAVLRLYRLRLTWRQIHRTREFVGQKQSDIYGALALVYDRVF